MTVLRAYSTGVMQVAEEAPAPERQHRVFWWKEALIVAVFYVIYSWTRNQFGSNKIAADGVPEQAFTNAERVIHLERWMGLFHEQAVQSWFLPYRGFIQFWNTYYGVAHFVVTLAVFVLLYVKRADVFPQWRNTLAAMTALAIIGFAWFPLMPPRLLDEPCPIPADVAEALSDAGDLLAATCDGMTDDERAAAIIMSELLDAYNNGFVGPGHCDGDFEIEADLD